MPHVNVLPLDVLQVAEVKGINESSSSQAGEKFSQVIDQEFAQQSRGKEAKVSQSELVAKKESNAQTANLDSDKKVEQSVQPTNLKEEQLKPELVKSEQNTTSALEAKEKSAPSENSDKTKLATENKKLNEQASASQEGDDTPTNSDADESSKQFLSLLSASEKLLPKNTDELSKHKLSADLAPQQALTELTGKADAELSSEGSAEEMAALKLEGKLLAESELKRLVQQGDIKTNTLTEKLQNIPLQEIARQDNSSVNTHELEHGVELGLDQAVKQLATEFTAGAEAKLSEKQNSASLANLAGVNGLETKASIVELASDSTAENRVSEQSLSGVTSSINAELESLTNQSIELPEEVKALIAETMAEETIAGQVIAKDSGVISAGKAASASEFSNSNTAVQFNPNGANANANAEPLAGDKLALNSAAIDSEANEQVIADNAMKTRVVSEQLNNGQNSNSHHTRVINQSTESINGLSSKAANSEMSDQNAQQDANSQSELFNFSEQQENVLTKQGLVAERAQFQQTLSVLGASASSAALESAQMNTSSESLLNKMVDESIATGQNTQLNKTPVAQAEVLSIYRKDFANALKEKVMVMINQKLQQVDIQLDPPELGNVQVRVNLQGEQAAVSIVVQNQQAKDALEENVNKLKDMLAQTGIDVGDTNIEQNSQSNDEEQQGQFAGGQNQHHEENNSKQVTHINKVSSSGVDYFA